MYELSKSCHGQSCIELIGGEEKLHGFLRHCLRDNWMTSPAYRARRASIPFLQGQDKGWTLVEFWGRDVEEFVAWLNTQITENTEYYQGFCEIVASREI